MSRVTPKAFLILAGAFAVLAPTLAAQNPVVCIFQQKQGKGDANASGPDGAELAKELVAHAGTVSTSCRYLASTPKTSRPKPSAATAPGSSLSGVRRLAPTPRIMAAAWGARRR